MSHFWFLLAILLVVSKGLRHALWMPSTSTSGEALWRSFKEEPTAAVIEALLHVPDFVEERYRYELQSVLKEIERKRIGGRKLNIDDFPGEPWRFYNIAAIILEDRYSTQDPVEALRLYLAQAQAGASGHLGQRLAYQGLLGRLWGPESNREDFFRYVFRRDASGKESAEERFDERLRRKARRLFGKDYCRFLRHHEFDFLHWYLDARKEKATLGAQLLNLLTYRQLMFFIAYLFSKDKRIGDIYRFANFGEMEPVCPTYALFIDRHIGSLELVLDYYRGLDSTFFGNRLPLWVCHKDPQDFIVHEDQTPWLNTKSVEAPRDYNYDFTNEGQRSFYESDTLAEPLYNWTWWFFWAPLHIC